MARDKKPKTRVATIATCGANDLGIPDGLDPKDYEGTKSWIFSRWRWEFIRRDKDFCNDSQDLLALMTACGSPSPCKCGRKENACLYPGKLERFREVWRYTDAVNHKERWVDEPSGDHERLVMGIIGNPISATRMSIMTPGMHTSFSMRDNEGQPGRLSDHEMVVKFDIDRPLSDQLKWAEVLLEEEQISRRGKKLQYRPRPDKWLKYLIMLDACEAEVSAKKIPPILSMTAGNAQTARDTIQQAQKLQRAFRSDDYRLIDCEATGHD